MKFTDNVTYLYKKSTYVVLILFNIVWDVHDFLIFIEKKRKVIYNKGISISVSEVVRYLHQYTVTNSAITSCLMNSFAIDDAIFLNDGKVLNKIKIHSIQVCIICALWKSHVFLRSSKILFICKKEVRFKAQIIIFYSFLLLYLSASIFFGTLGIS